MPPEVEVQLRELAGKVALRLVVDALERMSVAGPTIVLEPLPGRLAQRALPPAPRAKGTPKTKRARGRPKKAQTPAADVPRRCAKVGCQKFGKVAAVPGQPGAWRCQACGHQWKSRGKYAKAAARAAAGAPTVKAGACYRCDHPASTHEGGTGRCLEKRCICTEFYA